MPICQRARIFAALAITFVSLTFAPAAWGHPSSGIVVDKAGNVFFSDLSRGFIKIDSSGKASTEHREGGHWLALDSAGAFANVDFAKSKHWPRWFKRRTSDGQKPALIADGGSPLVVARDGHLYYACDDEQMNPGGLQLARLGPDGTAVLLNPELRKVAEELGGIKGLSQGPDDSLFVSFPKAILKINLQGEIATVKNPVAAPSGSGQAKSEPSLRGLAVDSHSAVYVAATGWRCVLKIRSGGQVDTVLAAEEPWAPCGVALLDDRLYVLEHINANSEQHEDWPPRERRLDPSGEVTTLISLQPKAGVQIRP